MKIECIKQTLVKIAFFLVMSLCILGCKNTESEPEKPNIILIMPDDAGYGDYACLGSPIIRMDSASADKMSQEIAARNEIAFTKQ
jgi:hypothetical protein